MAELIADPCPAWKAGALAPPEDEIEITPAMLRAGVIAFVNYDSRFENEATCVENIYRSMVKARVCLSPQHGAPTFVELWDRVHEECERCRAQGLPPPTLPDLRRLVG